MTREAGSILSFGVPVMTAIDSLSSAHSLSSTGRDAPPVGRTHTIDYGDTVSAVAQRYGVDVASLLSANPQIRNPDVVYPGDTLQIPSAGAVSVRSGDTLSGIAVANGTTVQALLAANPQIRNPDLIQIGQTIALPGSAAPTPPATSTPPSTAPTVPGVDTAPPAANDADHRLGQLSEQYETGGRGPGTVSTGQGDPGGVSYGSYQLATNRGRPQEFLANEGVAWAAEFGGAAPGTQRFSATWREIAAREPQAFADAQHAFIQRTHYDVQAARVETNTGLDVGTRSSAVQDAVWATAVQHGPTTNAITNAVRNVAAQGVTPEDGIAYDRALIDAIYTERGRRGADGNLVYFSSSPASTQASVANRFVAERADALAMLDAAR